jgi:hypothetical protein
MKLGGLKKSDTDYVAQISWEKRERTTERFHDQTEIQFTEMKICSKRQYSPAKTGYSSVTRQSKIRVADKSEYDIKRF